MPVLPLALIALAQSCDPATLRATLDSLAGQVPGKVGIAIRPAGGRETIGIHLDERFPMQSVYKLPIVMTVLDEADRGKLSLERPIRIRHGDIAPVHSPIREQYPDGNVNFSIRQLARAAIVESDGTASDVLLDVVSTGKVRSYLRRLEIDSMVVATSEKEMAKDLRAQYRNWSTPRAAVALLEALDHDDALAKTSRSLLLGWLTETTIGPDRLRGGLPAGTKVAHKTGTDRTVDGITRATNDVGLVTLPDGTKLAIAVFVADSPADLTTREGAIAAVAKVAWRCQVGKPKS